MESSPVCRGEIVPGMYLCYGWIDGFPPLALQEGFQTRQLYASVMEPYIRGLDFLPINRVSIADSCVSE